MNPIWQGRGKVGARFLDVSHGEGVTGSKEGRDDCGAMAKHQDIMADVGAKEVKNRPGGGIRGLAKESFPGFAIGGVLVVSGWGDIRIDELGDVHRPDFIICEIIESGENFAIGEVVDMFPEEHRKALLVLSEPPGAGALEAVSRP
jgi:hypothetical protein